MEPIQRVGCVGVLVGLVLVAVGCVGGLQAAWVAGTNPSPTEVACADFVREPPRATWIRLTGCSWTGQWVSQTGPGSTRTVWVPLSAQAGTAPQVLLESQDAALQAALEQAQLSDGANVAPALEVVDGTVAFGFDPSTYDVAVTQRGRTRVVNRSAGLTESQEAELGLAAGYAVVRHHGAPSFACALGELCVGGFGGVLTVMMALLVRRAGDDR